METWRFRSLHVCIPTHLFGTVVSRAGRLWDQHWYSSASYASAVTWTFIVTSFNTAILVSTLSRCHSRFPTPSASDTALSCMSTILLHDVDLWNLLYDLTLVTPTSFPLKAMNIELIHRASTVHLLWWVWQSYLRHTSHSDF